MGKKLNSEGVEIKGAVRQNYADHESEFLHGTTPITSAGCQEKGAWKPKSFGQRFPKNQDRIYRMKFFGGGLGRAGFLSCS
ncbi:MAG: hypothetical protein ACREFR_13405, partial [Limisphaerales bacterium]